MLIKESMAGDKEEGAKLNLPVIVYLDWKSLGTVSSNNAPSSFSARLLILDEFPTNSRRIPDEARTNS